MNTLSKNKSGAHTPLKRLVYLSYAEETVQLNLVN